MKIKGQRRIPVKYWRWLILSVLILVLAFGVFWLWLQKVPASVNSSSGQITYSWSHDVVRTGQSTYLSVRISTGVPVDTVMALVEFDPKKLEFTKASYEDSKFTTQIPAINKPDSVMVQSALMGGGTVDGDTAVAKLNFKSKVDHRPSARVTGNSAKAGVAMNPGVGGSFLQSGLLKKPVFIRIIASIVSAGMVVGFVWVVVKLLSKKFGFKNKKEFK